MNEHYLQPESVHVGRAVLGFFMTFIMTVILLVTGYLAALKGTILKGDNVNEILSETGFYDAVRDTAVNEIYDNAKKYGFSRDGIASVLNGRVIEYTTTELYNSLANDTDVDMSFLKDECAKIAEDTCTSITDAVFSSIDNSTSFSADDLSEIDAVVDFEKDYGIDVAGIVKEEMISAFGTDSVPENYSRELSEKLTEHVEKALSENLTPSVNNVFDEYIAKINYNANRTVHELNAEYRLSDAIKISDFGLKFMFTAIIILYAVVLAFFVIQMIIYRHDIHRALKNLSVSLIIPGIILLISAGLVDFLSEQMTLSFSSFHSSDIITRDFIVSNMSHIAAGISVAAIVYAVIFAVSFALSLIIRNRRTRVSADYLKKY